MWPQTEQTEELLNRADQGDDAAINQLMDRHRDALTRLVALRMDRAMAGRVDASDVVQDVLIEAHRRLEAYLAHPQMPFHLWLRQLAKDRMIDLHRRHRAQRRDVARERSFQGAQPDRSSLNLAAVLPDHEITPATAAMRQELQRKFLAAVDDLDENDREVIVMRHVEQLTNSEVAQALQLSEAAAGMRYLRAIRRLRALLGESTPNSL